MFGIFGKLFGSQKSTDNVIDIAKRTGDALVFTDEERAAWGGNVRQWVLDYLAATAPQTLARRFIAIAVTLLWCGLIILAVAVYPFAPAYADTIYNVLKDVVAVPFAGIMAFYFATHVLRNMKGN